MPMRDAIQRLVQENRFLVLATASNNLPHTSLMSYAADEAGHIFYMTTLKETAKYRNLSRNPNASLLLDTRLDQPDQSADQMMALTVDGEYVRAWGSKEQEQAEALLIQRHPHLAAFLQEPDAVLVKIQARSFLLLHGLREAYFKAL